MCRGSRGSRGKRSSLSHVRCKRPYHAALHACRFVAKMRASIRLFHAACACMHHRQALRHSLLSHSQSETHQTAAASPRHAAFAQSPHTSCNAERVLLRSLLALTRIAIVNQLNLDHRVTDAVKAVQWPCCHEYMLLPVPIYDNDLQQQPPLTSSASAP
ncbi:hypothetical protein IE81DRAFT_194277 [Ceraceosorus guamensis]|uniref:Uncharacterized protein n=1 Tax=Ceraceosorus guamensis TaxID=1522189 RepID=A0A316W6N6_9BASI|nr:hypothetical protein IE81DRAFT_194277 [Ceraceosorus guamensis]PWN45529.1 hypothetical protein IE81DRAFT_194277 [Ceraceosorus guamensis]